MVRKNKKGGGGEGEFGCVRRTAGAEVPRNERERVEGCVRWDGTRGGRRDTRQRWRRVQAMRSVD